MLQKNPQQHSTEEHDKARSVVNVLNVSTFINNYFMYFRSISTKCFTDLELKTAQITSKKQTISNYEILFLFLCILCKGNIYEDSLRKT